MVSSLSPSDYGELPTPVAGLLARGARSAELTKRHECFLKAWEVSLKIAVFREPPRDPAARAKLAADSLGTWRDAFPMRGLATTSPPLLALRDFLRRVAGRKATRRGSASVAEILELLPSYRNVIKGHGAPRSDEFYREACEVLGEALCAAWAEGVFVPVGAQLVYPADVRIDGRGKRIGRLFLLEGPMPHPEGEGVPVPKHVLPHKIYLRHEGVFTALHPWLLFENRDPHDRTLLFNGSDHGLKYLDCDTGDVVSGTALPPALEAIDPTGGGARSDPPPPSSADGPSQRAARPQPRSQTRRRLLFVALSLLSVSLAVASGLIARARLNTPAHMLRQLAEELKKAPPAEARARVREACDAIPLGAVYGGVDRLLLVPPWTGRVDLFLRKAGGEDKIAMSDPECVAIATPSRSGDGSVWFRVGRDPTLELPRRSDTTDEHLGYVRADALVPLAGPRELSDCLRSADGGLYGMAIQVCRSAVLSRSADDAARAAATLGHVLVKVGQWQDALTWLVAAIQLGGGGPRETLLADVQAACTGFVPGVSPGTRRFMFASWPWNDRMVRLSPPPGAPPGNIALPSGTCALVDDSSDAELLPADAWVQGRRYTGLIHRDMLMPK